MGGEPDLGDDDEFELWLDTDRGFPFTDCHNCGGDIGSPRKWLAHDCAALEAAPEVKEQQKDFKPGDRVRITQGYYVGRTATVDENVRRVEGAVCLSIDGGLDDHYTMAEWCKPLNSEENA